MAFVKTYNPVTGKTEFTPVYQAADEPPLPTGEVSLEVATGDSLGQAAAAPPEITTPPYVPPGPAVTAEAKVLGAPLILTEAGLEKWKAGGMRAAEPEPSWWDKIKGRWTTLKKYDPMRIVTEPFLLPGKAAEFGAGLGAEAAGYPPEFGKTLWGAVIAKTKEEPGRVIGGVAQAGVNVVTERITEIVREGGVSIIEQLVPGPAPPAVAAEDDWLSWGDKVLIGLGLVALISFSRRN